MCAECDGEGRFRHLAPVPLRDWESLEIPAFYKLIELSVHERLAIIYLALYYMQQQKGMTP